MDNCASVLGMIAELVLDLAVGLAALGTLPEWTIDGTVEDVGVFSRRVPNRGRVTLALLPRSCLPHLRCIYRFEAPTDPFKVH